MQRAWPHLPLFRFSRMGAIMVYCILNCWGVAIFQDKHQQEATPFALRSGTQRRVLKGPSLRALRFLRGAAIQILFFLTPPLYAANNFGATIQLYTQLHSITVNRPAWVLLIRDVDHNQNIPYLFDIQRLDNMWLLFTYGKNYEVVSSILQMNVYVPEINRYTLYQIHDFCRLESHGRVIQGESKYITLQGDLTTDPNSVRCHLSTFKDP